MGSIELVAQKVEVPDKTKYMPLHLKLLYIPLQQSVGINNS